MPASSTSHEPRLAIAMQIENAPALSTPAIIHRELISSDPARGSLSRNITKAPLNFAFAAAVSCHFSDGRGLAKDNLKVATQPYDHWSEQRILFQVDQVHNPGSAPEASMHAQRRHTGMLVAKPDISRRPGHAVARRNAEHREFFPRGQVCRAGLLGRLSGSRPARYLRPRSAG